MKPAKALFYFLLFISLATAYITVNTGCAQIGAPTGGPKDTLAPVLVVANPAVQTTHFKGDKIVFTFNEYVDVQDAFSNMLVNPYPKKSPVVKNKLRTVTVMLKDTLLPNTTYSIDFGNAIKDVNEGNIIRNFKYVFSTGDIIDSGEVKGNVTLAETGKYDSTMLVLLYKELSDTAVQKKKPNYIARVNAKGSFAFTNLPPGDYNIYALGDDNGSRTYDSKEELFAFTDRIVHLPATDTSKIILYAYSEEPRKAKATTTTGKIVQTSKKKPAKDNRLRVTTNLGKGNQDILRDLLLIFNNPIEYFDSSKVVLTDTNYHLIKNVTVSSLDSTRKTVALHAPWVLGTNYRLIIDTTAARDSENIALRRIDTLAFKTKDESEYATVTMRLIHYNPSRHPVIEFVQADSIVRAVPMQTAEWTDKLFNPGDYDLRVLFDDNENGKWDPGNLEEKRQPEKVISFDKKFTVKGGWENEREIEL